MAALPFRFVLLAIFGTPPRGAAAARFGTRLVCTIVFEAKLGNTSSYRDSVNELLCFCTKHLDWRVIKRPAISENNPKNRSCGINLLVDADRARSLLTHHLVTSQRNGQAQFHPHDAYIHSSRRILADWSSLTGRGELATLSWPRR